MGKTDRVLTFDTRRSSQRTKKITGDIQKPLHTDSKMISRASFIFLIKEKYAKMVPDMPCICLFMYECVCAPLAPENLGQFYSYSVFKSLSPIGRRPFSSSYIKLYLSSYHETIHTQSNHGECHKIQPPQRTSFCVY